MTTGRIFKMASSDEEDIEALRLAALATIKPKDEPQGIQVVSTVQQPAVPMQPFFEHPPTVEPFLEHKQVEDVDPDFAELQHAFFLQQQQQQQQLQHQQQLPFMNRGRGGFRGRGFGRGRGRGRGYAKFQAETNTFPPPLQQQSALIVIQTEIPEEEGRQKKGQEKRPLLLRPQDKWGMADTSSQSSSSPKPRDNSKFSRYDDDTDSEDDFEPAATDNDIDDDIAGDNDEENMEEDEAEENEDKDSHDKSFSETDLEVKNETSDKIGQDVLEDKECNEKKIDNNGSELIENSDLPEVLSVKTSEDTKVSSVESKENDTVEKDSSVLEQKVNSESEKIEEAKTVNDDVDTCHKKTGDIQDCDNDADKPSDSEVTSISLGNIGADVKQEDSVSNSYSTFSRFNRRRKKSDSGDESDSDMDDNSRQSNWSVEEKPKFNIASDNSSGPESDTVNHESETEDTKNDKHAVVQDKNTIIEDQTNVSRSRSHSRSRSLSSSSSRSSSASSSSSSSTSSSSSSSSASSSSTSSSQSKGKTSQNSEKESSGGTKEKFTNQEWRNLVKNEKDRSKHSSVSPMDKTKTTSELRNKKKDPYSDRKVNHSDEKNNRRSGRDKSPFLRTSYSSSKRSRSPRHEFQESRTPKRKRTHHSLSPIRDKEGVIEADPEFDAANYRKDGVFKKDVIPKNVTDKNDKKTKDFSDRYGSQDKSSRQISEIRHFKQITELKSEESNKSKRKSSEGKERYDRHDIKTSRNYKTDDKPINDKNAKSGRTGSKVIEASKNRHKSNSRSLSPRTKKRKKRSRSKTLQEKDIRSKSSPKYSKSADNFVVKRENDSRISKSSTELNRQKIKKNDDRNLSLSRDKLKVNEGMKGDSSSKDKRKSIEEKLKKIANLSSSSDSESSSEKSASSLSDMSSDSESETWRNKKSGASRDVDDIIRERQRRKHLERERRRNSERDKEREKKKMDRGDGDRSRFRDTGKEKSDKLKSDRGHKVDDIVRERQHGNRKMIILEEKSKRKPVFEELSSESDSERKSFRSVSSIVAGGRVSNIVSGSSSRSNIPSLLDINVSQPRVSKLDSSAKTERLVIQVGQSSDDERGKIRTKHKRNKLRKGERKQKSEDKSDDENGNWSRKHIVSVTYNQDSGGSDSENPRKSVYERLGIQISSSSKPSTNSQRSQDSRSKRHHDRSSPQSGKRAKHDDQRKHSSSRKHHKAEKQDKEKGQDEALNKRIQQIQEKNAKILRRKMEVEQDKQKYG